MSLEKRASGSCRAGFKIRSESQHFSAQPGSALQTELPPYSGRIVAIVGVTPAQSWADTDD